jgi:cytochrome P450
MELFRPLADSTLLDPHPMYHRLRAAEPVHWYEPLSAWVISRYDDCHTVLTTPDVFSSDFRRAGIDIPENLLSIQTLDPPEHGDVHRVLMDAYRRQDFPAIRARLDTYADQLLDKLVDRGPFDLVAEYAAPLAFAASAYLFGIPHTDEQRIVGWSEAIVAAMDSGLTPSAAAPGTLARDHLSAAISEWIDGKPAAGLLADLARAGRAESIPRDMIANTLRVMLHAGYAPSARFVSASVLALLRSPGGRERLLGTGVTDLAVKEFLRHSGPVQAVARVVAEDTELGGKVLRRGSDLIILVAAANRDPEQFTDPDDLVLDRDPNHNLGFGWGAHACVGASLARLTCSVALSALLRRIPNLALCGEPVQWPHATLRGLRELPIGSESH